MFYDTTIWYLSAVPLALAVVISAMANLRMGATHKELGGRVRSRQDLQPVREAINLNKRLAWVFLAVWFGQIGVLAVMVFSGRTTFSGALGHVFVFGVATLPFGLWSNVVEKKFRGMAVESEDPSVGQTWQRWLVEWKQASFSVKE